MTKYENKTQSDIPFAPTVIELSPAPTIELAFSNLSHLPGCLLLESAKQLNNSNNQPLGRYSFLMADPFETVIEPVGSKRAFDRLKDLMGKYTCDPIPDLPPMQGGLAGLFSYDFNRSIEKISPPKHDEFELPAVVVGAYDTVVAWDHELNQAWIISQGFPETEPAARKHHADTRGKYFQTLLELGGLPSSSRFANAKCEPKVELSGSFDVTGPPGLQSNFSAEGYIQAVQKCIDYIHAGDVFQINLTQRLIFPANCTGVELYSRLRGCNPAPFGGFFDLSLMKDDLGCPTADAQIISASPERFFSVREGLVETRPIKGTRRRTGRPMVDIQAREELVASEKDRAENTMIVDLMRNDLSRVCLDDSISVTQHCELEEYQSVLHLVSAVEGKLRPDCDMVDLLQAVFPGGSITGAPKVRSMEIISTLEPTARGAYCGALGYLGFNGNADLNILIRTITSSGGWWQIPVGGGIVSQSNPAQEHEETWTKAAGMLRAVTQNTAPNNR